MARAAPAGEPHLFTGAGRARLAALDAVPDDVQDELLAPLSARERAELTALLARVLGHSA